MARSMLASVWPARTSTPPSQARKGNVWPGIMRSLGVVLGSTNTLTVLARSEAEMPLATPCRDSTETVNAVPYMVLLFDTMSGMRSSSRRWPVRGVQMRPRPYFAMKLTFSGVIFSAGMQRSPSFSRSLSSMMMTKFPRRNSSTASSIVASGMRMASLLIHPVLEVLQRGRIVLAAGRYSLFVRRVTLRRQFPQQLGQAWRSHPMVPIAVSVPT